MADERRLAGRRPGRRLAAGALEHAEDFLHAGLALLDQRQRLLLEEAAALLAEDRAQLVGRGAGGDALPGLVADDEQFEHAGPAPEAKVLAEPAGDRVTLLAAEDRVEQAGQPLPLGR